MIGGSQLKSADSDCVLANPGRTSDLLAELARWPGQTLRVRDILDALGNKAYALLIVLFGLPNCLPMPPPIPLICGFLLAGLSIQLLIGRPTPWLPRFVLEQTISKALFEAATARAMPWLARIERVCRPRMAFMQHALALRFVGGVLLAMSLGLLVAAPFIGQIPIGIGVCLIGLGIVERDGLVVVCGAIVGTIGILLTASFAYAILRAIKHYIYM